MERSLLGAATLVAAAWRGAGMRPGAGPRGKPAEGCDQDVEIPLANFIPTAFGRRVQGMGSVEPDQINGLGFMLSDRKPGKFQMQVEWLKVMRAQR